MKAQPFEGRHLRFRLPRLVSMDGSFDSTCLVLEKKQKERQKILVWNKKETFFFDGRLQINEVISILWNRT
jgi:hypothetical protein